MANPRVTDRPKGKFIGMRCGMALSADRHLRCSYPSCACYCHEDDVTYPRDQYETKLHSGILQSEADVA